MAISVEVLASSPAFFSAVLNYARGMVAIYAENPRLASIFSSQQRWLMAQSGLALYHDRAPDDPSSGLYSGRFINYAVENDIASRNTAASFLQEMVAYRFARYATVQPDKRSRPLEPTDAALDYLWKWMQAHLAILDAFDGQSRTTRLDGHRERFGRLQTAVAHALVGNDQVRRPGPTFDLFTWVNSGGVVMDDLFSRIDTFDPHAAHVRIGPVSPSDLSERFMISKTHLKRIFDKAARLGSMGWERTPGRGDVWLSKGFIREYWDYQAEKFALIDRAFDDVFQPNTEEAAPAACGRAPALT
ncbi:MULTISPECIES: hypothetical protein [unclassified Ensifer]|uniref:hypothetical protein n=1 Tax=unclassified Ensifer TaxID=2633371 RepID=UPI00081311E1|nr:MULTISPECIES: hypothetical protein [unclassified Ensifer]OCP09243.1 hypothetical protein BC374_01325 [Ensifer sp. LC13]OCP10429.1 hypothetical protein BBX50_01675 [Ensifer sp. LC11]OCP13969.1 hypothetical protein BC362_04280 [Ensifer sp. LC14]OCP32491.1 hypothetical protein BC364_01325 [Ensifer sp. LC499]